SASGMSALSLCLLQMEQQMGANISQDHFIRKASFLARLGSGSACRSISGPIVSWGEHNSLPGSSPYYGTQIKFDVASVFMDFQDTILLVDSGKKEVSSTVGHNLMNGHPYAENRFKQAEKNIDLLIKILKAGDTDGFVKLVEQEALTLHAMMMTSAPYFILMKENTLAIINKIWSYRKESGIPVCFTLDAGANVHLLYPAKFKSEIHNLIDMELAQYCQNRNFIHDYIGNGAKIIN
ncbi:MAG: diphosphomevalonate decarboxylase, partial [Leeuwenhoekiella sp.]